MVRQTICPPFPKSRLVTPQNPAFLKRLFEIMKKHATPSDWVAESRATGFAGFSTGASNRARLRREVAHKEVETKRGTIRFYRVADLLEFKAANQIYSSPR